MIQICKSIWKDFFGDRIDEIPFNNNNGYVDESIFMDFITNWYFTSEWFEKYDFIEFLSIFDSEILEIEFNEKCNIALEREMAGYRLVENCIVQITSEEEIAEIEEAISSTSIWESVNTHLKTALVYFSNRENPDYRNSVKESISAVESLCIIITGNPTASFRQAIIEIEKKYKIHKALKSAFSSLYGYTSDSGGIRHALLEDDINVTMEDAKFMLVTCSAFINYLKVKL
jgi:hypothetical protein